ncbi:hypothetical protein B0H66DRAFT_606848 [Apodospora peruviana]|uniref:Uncharacterized protein n=1 Tax=Apodospora peruviana TaxID=516989 RepID=A0AAE0LZP4_9PEZI|nr:hypothetical protein B0H66DRAFT_606848 [Apodospora peruviana]
MSSYSANLYGDGAYWGDENAQALSSNEGNIAPIFYTSTSRTKTTSNPNKSKSYEHHTPENDNPAAYNGPYLASGSGSASSRGKNRTEVDESHLNDLAQDFGTLGIRALSYSHPYYANREDDNLPQAQNFQGAEGWEQQSYHVGLEELDATHTAETYTGEVPDDDVYPYNYTAPYRTTLPHGPSFPGHLDTANAENYDAGTHDTSGTGIQGNRANCMGTQYTSAPSNNHVDIDSLIDAEFDEAEQTVTAEDWAWVESGISSPLVSHHLDKIRMLRHYNSLGFDDIAPTSTVESEEEEEDGSRLSSFYWNTDAYNQFDSGGGGSSKQPSSSSVSRTKSKAQEKKLSRKEKTSKRG